MSQRKIDALRRLAERPGTEAEGLVAREMLAKLEAKNDPWIKWDLEDFPESWICPCGARHGPGVRKCNMRWFHLQIQTEIRAKFSKGDRVYYNFWAYSKNSQGIIAGYCKLLAPENENGSFPWAWLRIKFDHLKTVRAVPIYHEGKCCLTHEPVG